MRKGLISAAIPVRLRHLALLTWWFGLTLPAVLAADPPPPGSHAEKPSWPNRLPHRRQRRCGGFTWCWWPTWPIMDRGPNWTFDDAHFRIFLLRGMAWAAGENPYRWDHLVLTGLEDGASAN